MQNITSHSGSNLPAELQALLDTAISGHVDYPDRAAQWERIQHSLQNGDHTLATIQLNSLCNQQNGLRSGVPSELQALLDAAASGHIDYPDRAAQWKRIQHSLQNGDHTLATIQLNSLCNQQNSLRNGVPPELQALLNAAASGRVDYPDRAAQWERIQHSLQNGDHTLATIQLNSLCNQQNGLRSGVPSELQALLDAAASGYVDYPDRAAQWKRIQHSLQNGDHTLATIQLNSLCNQQNGLRSGVPSELQALLDAADSGHVDYPDRAAQWERILRSLQNGDHTLATILLNSLCDQQNALRPLS